MVTVPSRDAIVLSAMFESLRILRRLRDAEENSKERKRQEEILASYQTCTKKLLS